MPPTRRLRERGRRITLRRTLSLCILVCACVLPLLPVQLRAGAEDKTDAKAGRTAKKRLTKLARAYKIEIVVPQRVIRTQSTHGVIDGTPARDKELDRYWPILLDEFARYPVAFLRKTGLRRFVVCNQLSFNEQMRYAIPDFPHDTMYLCVEWPSWYTPSTREQFEHYLRKVFHHELFHLIDWKDDGLLYRDDVWIKLNPPAFQYGKGGANMRDDPTVSMITDKIPGFVSGYSTAGVEEDKAEIYANMMANTAALAERAQRDPIVAKKVEAMVALLDTYSETASELLAGVIPPTKGPLRFAHLRVVMKERKPSSPQLDAARKSGRPLLLFVRRRAWRRATKAEGRQARATGRLESGLLRDKKIAAALDGWSLLSLDLGSTDADKFAGSLGARKAPALLVWRAEAERPTRLPMPIDAAALLRKLKPPAAVGK